MKANIENIINNIINNNINERKANGNDNNDNVY